MPVSIYRGTPEDSQVFTPEQMSRIQAERQKLVRSNSRARTLLQISSRKAPDLVELDRFGIPGLNDDPSFLQVAKNLGAGALDILGRGNFAVAGLVDELLVKKTGPIQALARVGKEVLSGIGGIEGEKDTFRDILDAFDIGSETRLGDAVAGADGIPIVAGFNMRGTLGLALDIFLDPLTYLTGGGSALAKVPTKFRSAISGGTGRLLAQTDDAVEVLTRKGVKAKQGARAREFEAIRAAPEKVGELTVEAHRQAIEAVQDELHAGLMRVGMKAGRAGDLSESIVPDIGKIITGDATVDGVKRLQSLLRRLNSRTAARVKQSLGLDRKARRTDIGEALAAKIGDRAADMMRTGIDKTGELSALAADIAEKRAMDTVLEMAKGGTKGLTRDLTPLRFMGRGIGPAGKTLTEWAVQSEVSSRVIGALKRTLPEPVIGAGLVASRFMKDKLDVVGRMFNESWDARRLRGFHMLRRAHLDGTAAAVAKNLENLKRTGLAKWYDNVIRTNTKNPKQREAIFREFAFAIDSGDLSKLEGETLAAAQEFQQIMRDTVSVDVRKGLMKADNVRKNYFPHFIDHPERILTKLIAARPGRAPVAQNTIGRFAELRHFETLADIEAAAKLVGVDARINFDPMQALRNRTQATVEGSMYQDFYDAVAHELGEKVEKVDPRSLFQLGEPLVDVATGKYRIAEKLARGKFHPTADQLDRLVETHGAETAGEFLRQRMLRLTGQRSIERFMGRYEQHMHLLPRLPALETLAPDGSRYVTMPHQYGKTLGSYRIPESAAESIRRMRVQTARAPELDEFLSMFDGFTNTLKVSLTALFPAFHFRNLYSNVAQNFLDIGIAALNPVKALRSARLYNMVYDGKNVLPRTPVKWLGPSADATAWTEVGGRHVSMVEAAQELRRNNIVRNHDEIFEATSRVSGRVPKGATPAEGKPFHRRALSSPGKVGREVGGWVENEGRIALYGELRSRGLSEAEATVRVNKLLFDYDSLTEFERVYLKRAIPFYVWTKKNVALQAHAMRQMPGRQANLLKPFRDDNDSDVPLLEYETGQFRIQMDQNGKDVRMLTGIDLPIMSIDRILPIGKLVRGDFAGAWKSVAAQMNPILKTPQELAANQTFFDERSMDRTTSQSIGKLLDPESYPGRLVPKAAREWLEFQKTEHGGKSSYSFHGKKFYLLFKTWHLSRFVSSSDAWFNRASQDSNFVMNSFALLTSLKEVRVNLDEKRRRVLDERIEKIEQALSEMGHIRRKSTSFELKDSPRYRQVR